MAPIREAGRTKIATWKPAPGYAGRFFWARVAVFLKSNRLMA